MMKMALWRNRRLHRSSELASASSREVKMRLEARMASRPRSVSDVTPFSLYPCQYFLRKEVHRYKGKSRRMTVLPKTFGTRCLQQKVPTLQAQV